MKHNQKYIISITVLTMVATLAVVFVARRPGESRRQAEFVKRQAARPGEETGNKVATGMLAGSGSMAQEAEVTAKAKPCDETVLTPLDLSRPPTEAELIAAGNLGKKLTPTRNAEPSLIKDPVARKLQETENLAFGHAIQAWNRHHYKDAVELFESFLASHPESPWAAEAMLHLGCHCQYNARFVEASEWFDKSISASGSSSEMLHKSKLRRAIVNIDLGKLDEASTALSDTLATNSNANENTYASYWIMQVSFLKKHEAALRDCGQKALARIAAIAGDHTTAAELSNLPSAGAHGFTATELFSTAVKYGLSAYPVNATLALDQMPLPFVAHYKSKHYVAVEGVNGEEVRVYDSRIGATTSMPRSSFEKEWSGFALAMKQPPEVPEIHPAENLDAVTGGCCGIDRLVDNLGKDECEKGCNTNRGLPGHSVNPINMNFKVVDTPMWWDPPVGPVLDLTLVYNSQDSQNNYTPFGNKWSFEYASYLMITPGNGVQVRDGDGRIEMFAEPSGGTSSFPVTYTNAADPRVLVQTQANVFTLTHQDGTVFHYRLPTAWVDPNGPNYIPPPQGYVPPPVTDVPMLVQIKDRHNNSINMFYNAQGALIRILHSALPGSWWILNYSNIGSVSRVTRIDDPFGRSAHFSYDPSGNLTGQTDMGGLSYSYTYELTKGGLMVSGINRPTGSVTIHTEAPDGIENLNNNKDASLYQGVTGYDYTYPLPDTKAPGRVMWDNYRITIKDSFGYPSEYYFDGSIYGGDTYYRSPAEMEGAQGMAAPRLGAGTVYDNLAIGSRAVTGRVYRVNATGTTTLYDTGDYTSERWPRQIWNGFRYDRVVSYNSKGRPNQIKISEQQDLDHLLTFTYQSNGIDVDTVTRTRFGTQLVPLIDCDYYANRDLKSVTDALGRKISYDWYGDGRLWKVTDNGTTDVIEIVYDTNFRPYQVKVNGKVVSTTTYDTKGNLLQVIGADGRLVQYGYDSLNRMNRELRPDNSFTAYDWACCFIEKVREGKVVNGTDRTLRQTVIKHDSRGLPVSSTETDGGVTRFDYDGNGRMVTLTDPKNQTTRWKYKTNDQLEEKIYPDTSKEIFEYDDVGRILTMRNRRSQLTTLTYHSIEGGVENIYSGANTLTITPDTWGRIDTITQSASSSTVGGIYDFEHDWIGRVTEINGPWTDDTISWEYNGYSNHLTTVTRKGPGGFAEVTTNDAYGRIQSVENLLGTFTNSYDDTATTISSLLLNITHSGANAGFNTAFTWHGDAFDRALESITSTKPGGGIIGKHIYGYDSKGRISSWKREAPLANPAGATRQFESKVFYDAADQVSSLLHTPLAGSSVAESAHHYVYDPAGNIASKGVEAPATGATMTAYSHNSLNQLTAIGGTGGARTVVVRGSTSEAANVKVKSGTSSTWKDARILEGNRFEADLDLATGANEIDIQAKDGSQNTSNYTYSLALAAAAAAAPTYEGGNMTSDGTRGYEWDIQNRLVKITWGAGSNKSTEFKYNALGQRAERIEKTGSTETAHYYYLYDGIKLLCRYTGGTAVANIDRRYFGQGEQRKNGASWDSHYYTRDHLGSIREVMNSDGTLAARYDYDPYGKRRAEYLSSNYADGCDLGYTGHITQPSPVAGQTDMVMTFFRAYDPELGRWLSADPIGEEGGVNLYGYVGGFPLDFLDPYGLSRKGKILGALLGVVYAYLDGDPQTIIEGDSEPRPGIEATCENNASASGGGGGKGKVQGKAGKNVKGWKRTKGYKRLGKGAAITALGAAIAANQLTRADLETVAKSAEKYILTGSESDFVVATSMVRSVDEIAGTAFFVALEEARKNHLESECE